VSDRELDQWTDALPYLLDHLRDRYLPDDFRLDYNYASLAPVERVVLDRYPAGAVRPTAGGEDFVRSVMAFLGEVLLRTGGGRWIFHEVPLIAPDEALELPPISPLQLISDAVTTRTGEVFTDAYDELQEAVEELQEQDPSWEPTKEYTTSDDTEVEVLPEVFRRWLADREAGFARWIIDAGGVPEQLDFSPASLDALHALVRRNLPGGEDDVRRPERQWFVDGAVWYFGEVVRRNHGARWQYREGPRDNPVMNRPTVKTFGPYGNESVPAGAIQLAAGSPDPSPLYVSFSRFED
jgi:hypothetical protein